VNASDVSVNQPLLAGVTNIGGTPVAGSFDGNATNGDEVALKVGNTWLLDKFGHDFVLETKLPGTNMVGLPIVGDFDNDGIDDLGSWADDKFYLNLSTLGPIDGTADRIFTFGFASVRERPVAGDFDGDNITDLGLWVPDRAGVAPSESAEWYLLLSGGTAVGRGGIVGQGQTILDRLNSPTGVVFTPAPFGNDRFAQFGDEFGLPVPGNFDPPITSANPTVSHTNPELNLDVNNDGFVSAFDALLIINKLNSANTALANTLFTPSPFLDVNGDGICSSMDALVIINWLNTNVVGSESSGAGEAVNADSVFAELGDEAGADESLFALLAGDVPDGRKGQIKGVRLL
jgi:Dockerin type I domain